MNDKTWDDIKRLAEAAPLIGGFLVFLGVLKLTVFYWYWGVDIFHYLNFQELILSFLDDIVLLCAFLFSMLANIFIIGKLIHQALNIISSKIRNLSKRVKKILHRKYINTDSHAEDGDSTLSEKDVSSRFSTFEYIIVYWFSIILIKGWITNPNYLVLWVSILYLFLHISIIGSFYGITIRKNNGKAIIFGSIMVITFGLMGLFNAHYHYLNPRQCEIRMRNGYVIRSSVDTLFIDQSSEFYFFWNRQDNSILTIPKGEVGLTIQK